MEKRTISCVLIAGFLNIMALPAAIAETIPVWTYHLFPPFVIDQEKREGLSYDLADLLTERSNNAHRFEVVPLPRERLNLRLASDNTGVVFWVNPAWFGDKARKKFLWTSKLLTDENSIISPKSNPIEFENAESLTDKDLVSVRGHKFMKIDKLVAQGHIKRVDVSSEKQIIQLISNQRNNVAVVASSAAKYYVKKLDVSDKIHFSKKPQSQFERYILVQPQLDSVHTLLTAFTDNLAQDKQWQDLIKKYGM